MKPTSTRTQTFAFVLLCLFLIFIGLLCVLSYKYPNTPSFVMFIIGNITGVMGTCSTFLFGSTQGSQAKDAAAKDTLDKAVTQLAASNPPAPVIPPVIPIPDPLKPVIP